MQFWVQDVKPAWLPEGFQVPPEMLNHVQQLCKEAEIAYYQTDKDKNGFLRRREFKKAMKYLGINKHEARHMLIFIDRERLKVVSIKNYVNAYLFIKSGGLNHINTDYQGPITTGPDNRTHMKIAKEKMEQLESLPFNPAEFFLKAIPQTLSFPYIAQNVFQSVPRPFPVRAVIGFSATLQAWNGCYVCSENGRVIANRTVVGPWERFWYMSDPDWGLDQYVDMRAFKTYWNTYLCCENLGGIVDNRTSVGLWEKFKAIDPSFDNRQKAFAFKTWDDRYLTVQDDGIVGAVSTLGPKEVFILQYVGDY